MLRIFRIFLPLAIFPVVVIPYLAQADNSGYSFLGMCNKSWPCAEAKQLLSGEATPTFRWLDGGTFGQECTCVTELLNDPRPKVVAPHIANSTCFKERGRICNPDEVFYNETIARVDAKILAKDVDLLKRFDAAATLTKKHLSEAPLNTTVYVSPCLECNLSAGSRAILLDHTKDIFEGKHPILIPDGYIDNPLNGECMTGTLCERHGGDARADVVDLDGDDFREVDVGNYLSRNGTSKAAFLWGKEFNCLNSDSRQFVDPRERQCGQLPTIHH